VTAPDIVFPVRQGERNEELRYALRSLRLLPHGQVWLAGHKPRWVSDEVRHVAVKQTGSKYANSLRNLLTACQQIQLSEEFVYWNDDMFLLEPIDRVPVLHRGTLADHVAAYYTSRHSRYVKGLAATDEVLRRLLPGREPLSYELHTPMTMDKAGVLAAEGRCKASQANAALQIKSAYGNLHEVGGEYAQDVKVFKPEPVWDRGPTPFVSTIDGIWGRHPAVTFVQELHSEPSPYERT